jgi:hypothetical protein
MPVSTMPSTRCPQVSAADENSTSTDGRTEFSDVATHLGGGRGLFLDGARDGALEIVDLRDHATDLADRVHRAARVGLDRVDDATDIAGGLGRRLREILDLVRDDREALAGLAGARGLDRGVECEQVGLLRDRGDDLDDVADRRAELAIDLIDLVSISSRTASRSSHCEAIQQPRCRRAGDRDLANSRNRSTRCATTRRI